MNIHPDVGMGAELRRRLLKDFRYLLRDDGKGVLLAKELEVAGAEDVVAVVYDEARLKAFGLLGIFLELRRELAGYLVVGFPRACKVDVLRLEFLPLVVEALLLVEVAVQAVVEWSSRHALPEVVH